MDFLEFSDVSAEIKGSMTPGKIKMTDQHIIFKNSKTGRVEQIPAAEMEMVNFQNFIGSWGLRIFLKNGTLHRYTGFKDTEKEKVAKFFSSTYKQETLEKELSLKGWNWGTAKFTGSVLSFDIGSSTAFEIPLNHVSQCLTGKNEITMEFHQNDDAAVSLMEMRFFIPSNELAGDVDPVEAFQQQVVKKASVINVSGDAIAIFREIYCLTPRGRYDIKIFNTFFQLHGKTFDYKIPISTVLRLFHLPHKDTRQTFFVVSLDPPIKQGQTRYHFLVFQFGQDDETTVELPFTDEELKEKYEGKLERELSGPTHEVLGRVMKNIINRKIIGPGEFIGHYNSPVISCSFKAAAGYLYPLERGFIYIHKPPIHIRFEEIASVNFARSGGSTRSFDFEIELRSGAAVHTFSSIEKEEYAKLYDFCTSKKLHVKNRGKNDKPNYKDDFGDSDNEKAPDAYLERVKAEAQERDEDDGGSEEDESTDEDFNPDAAGDSDVALEFDSNHSDTSSDDGSDDGEGKEKKDKHKKERREKHKSSRTVSEKPRKRKEKKERDEDKPKRPTTAFMIWLNETRESIKSAHPGIKVTEIAKKGGEMWRELKDKSVWEKKAAKAKDAYTEAMKEYNASGGSSAKTKSTSSKPSSSAKPTAKKVSENIAAPKGGFKSKEYIESDSSSAHDDDDDTKAKKSKSKAKPPPKRKQDVEDKSKQKKAKKDESEASAEEEESDSDTDKKKTEDVDPLSLSPVAKKDKKKEESDEDADEEESDQESDQESDSEKNKKKAPVKKKPPPKKDEKKKDDKKAKASKKDESEEEDDDDEEVESTPASGEDSD